MVKSEKTITEIVDREWSKFSHWSPPTLNDIRRFGEAVAKAVVEECAKAVEDAGGDNKHYHADAIRTLLSTPEPAKEGR